MFWVVVCLWWFGCRSGVFVDSGFWLVVWGWGYMVCLWLGCVWFPVIGLAVYLVCCWALIAGFGL